MEQHRKSLIPYTLGFGAIAGVYIFIVYYALKDYIAWRSPGFLLGLIAIPLVMVNNRERRLNLRFYYIALAFCLLAWVIPAKTVLYMALAMAVCFLADTALGKINILPLLALFLMAPVCDYITQIFTFPIRLYLTAWAGDILALSQSAITVEGNAIFKNGTEFSVDVACMGLNMMITSMLCALMVLGFYQKKCRLDLSVYFIILLMAFTIALNVLSNLVRIIVLVQFSILPGDAMHDITGIVCLLAYVILPICWLIPKLVKRYGKISPPKPARDTHPFMIAQAHVCLAACVFLVAFKMTRLSEKKATEQLSAAASVPGYEVTNMKGGIIKMESDTSLIYVKSIPGFYFTDHHPTICWRGSGYEFHQVKEMNMGGKTIYTALLEKGEEHLYTAWWYDNGKVQTISQTEWRWDNLRGGRNYAIVNVSAADEKILRTEVSRWLQKDANLLERLKG